MITTADDRAGTRRRPHIRRLSGAAGARQGAEHHDLHRNVRHRPAQSRHGGRLCAARLQRTDAEPVLALRLSGRTRLRRAGPRRRLGAACGPRRRCRRPRYRHGGAVAARRSRFPTARFLRSASAPAAAWRSSRRRAPASTPRCRSTAWASPSMPPNSAAVNCPVQLHYGLKDPHIPRPEIDAVTRAGGSSRSNIEIFLYAEAGHSFFNPIRPGLPRRIRQARGRAARRANRAHFCRGACLKTA